MFEDNRVPIGTRSKSTMLLSLLGHVVIVGMVIVIPLMATGNMPTPNSMMSFAIAPPPPPPPAPPPEQPKTSTPPPVNNPVDPNKAPTEPPPDIKPEPPTPPPFNPNPGPPGKGPIIPDYGPPIKPMAPPPPPPPKEDPVRPGGDIKDPTRIHYVAPVYPAIAQQAKVQGYVIVEAIIGKDGKVRDAHVIKSAPLLDKAALEAVQQWQYQPLLLNGKPTEVIMSITVVFTLK